MPQPLVQSTGRRKQAIARVRVRANEAEGDGTITVKPGRSADYFPSKTHQMILTEPLRATELTEAYDIDATIDGGGPTGQAGRPAPRHRPGAHRDRSRAAAPLKQAGFLTRDAREKESQEVRPQEGPQGSAVLEALTAVHLLAAVRVLKFGTDGVRGRLTDLTPSWCSPWAAAPAVLGGRQFVVGRDTRMSVPAGVGVDRRARLPKGRGVTARRGAHAGGGLAGRRRGHPRRGDLRLPQPVPGQRGEAVRLGRPQAHRRGRRTLEATLDGLLRRWLRPGSGNGALRDRPTVADH